MRQIDLEEAIAAHPMTVREFASKNAVPQWRVRDSIRRGALVANDGVRPMKIVEGELALTVQEWQRAIEPAAKKNKVVCVFVERRRKTVQCAWHRWPDA